MKLKNVYLLFSLFFVLVAFVPNNVISQISQVEFVKVNGDPEGYLAIQKEWKKIHQQRLEDQQIFAWYLLKKHFDGTSDDYNFAMVTVFRSLGSISGPQAGQNELVAKTKSLGEVVKTEIYDTPIFIEIIKFPRFLNMEFMKVEQGNDENFLNLENEIWEPVHAERKKLGGLITWSVYRQLYPGGYGGDYNYVAVNGFSDRKKVTLEPPSGWDEVLKSVHPDIDVEVTHLKTFESRKLVETELWEILETVAPQ